MKYLNKDIVFREIPDQVTLAYNITECPHRCLGCHSPELRGASGDELTYDVVSRDLVRNLNSATDVLILGGDRNPIEIVELFRELKSNHPKILTSWYSGSDYIHVSVNDNLDLFDYIKIGHYDEELGPLTDERTNQELFRVVHPDNELVKINNLIIK